jgi:hypothetical protein
MTAPPTAVGRRRRGLDVRVPAALGGAGGGRGAPVGGGEESTVRGLGDWRARPRALTFKHVSCCGGKSIKRLADSRNDSRNESCERTLGSARCADLIVEDMKQRSVWSDVRKWHQARCRWQRSNNVRRAVRVNNNFTKTFDDKSRGTHTVSMRPSFAPHFVSSRFISSVLSLQGDPKSA